MNNPKIKETEVFKRIKFGGIPVALLYPNSYGVGMSNLGFQWAIYQMEKDRRFCVNRFFLEKGVLFSPDTEKKLKDFKYIFISISYELDFLNLIKSLKYSKIEPESSRRRGKNILIGGGVAFSINLEPISEIFDVVVLGDGENKLNYILDLIEKDISYENFLDLLSEYQGKYFVSQRLKSREKYVLVEKEWKLNEKSVPFSNIISNRMEFPTTLLIEISRGCPMGCRFCWAGFNLLPRRNFEHKKILNLLDNVPDNVKKVGLISTAVFEHPDIFKLLEEIHSRNLNVNFSSLRLIDLNEKVVKVISNFNINSVTIAPETGGNSLRKRINKNVSNEEIFDGIDLLFKNGIYSLKLYFLIGIPFEEEKDIFEIVDFIKKIRKIADVYWKRRGYNGEINISVNPLVPKPNTPFQFVKMEDEKILKRKMKFLKGEISKISNCKISFSGIKESLLQWGLSFGKKKLSKILIDENFNYLTFKNLKNDREFFNFGENPSEFYTTGIDMGFLKLEYGKSKKGIITPPCPYGKSQCKRCGICG